MKRILKKTLTLILCLLLMTVLTVQPILAAETVTPRYANVMTHTFDFSIDENGNYCAFIACQANPSTFVSATAHLKLQKKTLFWWSTQREYTDDNTYAQMSFTYTGRFDKTGTYRAVIELTIYGTGNADGSPDVLSQTIEAIY